MSVKSSNDLNYFCSHTWLPTVQEVLHADWQEAGHSPHPPVFKVLFNIALFTVLMCFLISNTPNVVLLTDLFYRFLQISASNSLTIYYKLLKKWISMPRSFKYPTQYEYCSLSLKVLIPPFLSAM